jgi:hypothetical protein
MDLRNLIETHLDLPRLSKDLDELGPWARTWAVHQWTRADMATLWEAAKGFRPLTLADFVPESVPPLVEVIHEGKNSLPAQTHFQKRFCRPGYREGEGGGAGQGRLIGYNRQSLTPLTGPGYYVAHPSANPGEVDIDYTMLPTQKPSHWPPIVASRARLGRFVYDGMIDVMRGLSSAVTIGRARNARAAHAAGGASEARLDAWLDTWFVLVRQEPIASARSPANAERVASVA